MMMKKLLAVFVALCLLLSALPVTVSAAGGDVSVRGVTLQEDQYLANGSAVPTSDRPESGGYVYYRNQRLVLHDAVITGASSGSGERALAGIYSQSNLTMILEGSSTVTAIGDGSECYGIYALDALTISGDGSLAVTAGDADSSYGIFAYSADITINGGTVSATGGEGDGSYGIYAEYGNITVNSGEVTALGGTAVDESAGIYAYYANVIVNGGVVKATGGDAEYTYGIFGCDNIEVLGGEVTAEGGSGKVGSYGMFAETYDVILAGDKVSTKGGAVSTDEDFDIYSFGIYSEENIILLSGEITATASSAQFTAIQSSSAFSYGMYANSDIYIYGGDISSTGGQAEYSAGMCASIEFRMTGGELSAVASADQSGIGYGIYAEYGDVKISAGVVQADGGLTGVETYGLYADSGNTVLTGETASFTGTTNSVYTVGLVYKAGLISDTSDMDTDAIIKWDASQGNTGYDKWSTDDLTVEYGSFDAWWDSYNERGVVAYGNASDKDNPDNSTEIPGIMVVGSMHVRNIELNSGDYLPNGENTVTNTRPSGGYVYYNKGTLTLHNAQITAPVDASGIISEYDLSIVLEGSNTVTGGDGSRAVGIFSLSNIRFSGSGSVTVTGGLNSDQYGVSMSVYSGHGDITIDSGTVTVRGSGNKFRNYGIHAANGDININGGTVNAVGCRLDDFYGAGANSENKGISSAWGSVNINGGTVTATAGQSDGIVSNAYGIFAYENVNISSANVTARGTGSDGYSYGIHSDAGINIFNSTVRAFGGNNCIGDSCGIHAVDGDIIISESDVRATGGNNNAEGRSIGIDGESDMSISGGTIEASGGTNSYISYGISTLGTLDISGSAGVTATSGSGTEAYSTALTAYGGLTVSDQARVYAQAAGAADVNVAGIEASASFEINDNASVTAVAGATSGDRPSYGVSTNNFTIYGGSLSATAGSSNDSKGISTSGAFFDGGTVTARGHTLAVYASFAGIHLVPGMFVWGAASTQGTLGSAGIYNNETIHLGEDASGSPAKYARISTTRDTSSSGTQYLIIATAGNGGSISPPGSVSVRQGADQEFAITPEEGYIISDVLVDGESVGPVERYIFEQVEENHTIEALFVWKSPFVDINPSQWFFEEVHEIYDLGLMIGTSNTRFSPSLPVTRAMMVTVLWRMEGSPVLENYSSGFEDLTRPWYTDAVNWAHSAGIVSGYSITRFAPQDPMTREQLITILWRYAKYKGYDVSVGEDTNILSFNDASTVSEWAVPAMQWAFGSDIIKGDGNRLMPGRNTTRAEAAAILQRFISIR